jgi:hypothetical protein
VDTPEQSALREEFARLYAVSGWNQVQCATELDMTQGYVSKILNDEVALEPATISHFKVRLAARHPEFLAAAAAPSLGKVDARTSPGSGKTTQEQDAIAELKESFEDLVKSDPEKALSLTEVISYLRSGKKKRKA